MAARTSTALVLIAALVAVVWAASSPFETTLQQALDSKVPTTNKRYSLTHSFVPTHARLLVVETSRSLVPLK